ncbi:alanine/glycine:cation symporter family protein [Brevibacterium luteolum]|uniref:alanine/glycine:cation symporter family protein n=1 Tax=Brevibacterium luteolum TaxID=199591 RepID=UPI00223B44D3|nr:alanine:cation symporter family protein [Brevibacterium luteolum]MCT1830563.1 alanine:cation symporter family protein [Brevibacterium luteolum]
MHRLETTQLLARTIDETINERVAPVSDFVEGIVFFAVPIGGVEVPLIIVRLAAAALFFTFYLRLQPITGFGKSLGIIRGRFTRKTDPGEVSSFQALATELSGTVGLGNIAGVALAVSLGGPGAALWIIIFGLFSMSVMMVEATLGVKYRTIHEDGTVSGGPMYFLRDGLADIGRPGLGRFLAIFYCLATLGGMLGAALFQSNQSTAILVDATGGADSFFADKLWLLGSVIALLVGIVVIGGIRRVATWTSRITPLMAILYFVCVLVIIVVHAPEVPHAIGLIVTGAFTGPGVAGGAVGVAIIGIQRALFSNAAGVGTAAMAHSASKTTKPASEGYVAMWEPLIDSVIVCSLTALAVTVTGRYETGASDDIELTAEAFRSVTAWFPLLLTVAAVLFAFSTMLAYGYYGQKTLGFMTGGSALAERIFQIVWVIFIVIGASASFDAIMSLADSVFFLMAVPNLLGIYFLAKVVRLEILRYRTQRDLGRITEVDEDLRVGMGDHDPTEEQMAAAVAGRKRKKERSAQIKAEIRELKALRAQHRRRP